MGEIINKIGRFILEWNVGWIFVALFVGVMIGAVFEESIIPNTQEEEVYENFVEGFMEMPFNQGLYIGMATTFYELKNQGFDLNSSDLNTESLSPEYYAIMSSLTIEHGSDSVSCWLIDTGTMYSTGREGYDCSIYEQELKRAKKMLKSKGRDTR